MGEIEVVSHFLAQTCCLLLQNQASYSHINGTPWCSFRHDDLNTLSNRLAFSEVTIIFTIWWPNNHRFLLFTFKLFQIENVPSPRLQILLEMMRMNAPEGVFITVKEVSSQH